MFVERINALKYIQLCQKEQQKDNHIQPISRKQHMRHKLTIKLILLQQPAGVDLSLLASISPIEWSNVILYGEYKLNRDLVR